MFKTMTAFVTACAFALPAGAAVSGFYDSAAKISAIFASSEVADALRQAPIRAIEEGQLLKDGSSLWIVRSQDCDLEVTLTSRPPVGVGRTEWKVERVGTC